MLMTKLFTTLIAATAITLSAAAGTPGQTPVMSLTSSLAQSGGADSYFVMYMGSTTDQTVIMETDAEKVEVTVGPATYDPTTQAIKSTQIAAKIGSSGKVNIYAEDAAAIDYLNCEGLYIRTLDISKLSNLEILNLNHNELESLDLSAFTKLQSLEITDNPFNVSPLVVGTNKPDLAILTLDLVQNLSPAFDLTGYPALQSFSAWAVTTLQSIDPSGCPQLRRLSIDNTNVAHLDITRNPELLILNISDTRITDIDLSPVPKLQQFYCDHQSATINPDIKLSSLDVSCCPDLIYLFCAGNKLTTLDLSKNTALVTLNCSHNLLTALDLSKNTMLYDVTYSYNNMDYVTMTPDPGTWGNWYWEQNDMKVDYSYPVGATIDLSDRVIIDGSETFMSLRGFNPTNPDGEDYEIEQDAYTYSNGVITLLKVLPDSVRAEFYNPLFPDHTLNTTRFKVKSAEEYGRPSAVSTFTTGANPGEQLAMRIGVIGASQQNPKTIYIDLGDGNPAEFTITTQDMPATPNVTAKIADYGTKHILVPDGVTISALGINQQLYSIDTDKMTQIIDLDLSGCGLYSVDLRYNYLLNRLNLADNNLYTVDLEGFNNAWNKQWLTDINLSHNNLSEFSVPDNRTLTDLNLAGNNISQLMLSDADNLVNLDVSGNSLTRLDLHYSLLLQSLNAASNRLSEHTLGEGVSLKTLDVSDNAFTFATLPLDADAENFVYAPQQTLTIPTKGPGVNLTAQYVTINGKSSAFAWFKADGTPVAEGTDYTINKGNTRFINTEMGNVYCEITNAALPALTLRTTEIEASEAPTHIIASFTTPVGGEIADLSFACTEGTTALYFDWGGNGDLTQYPVNDTYTLYSATTVKDADVKVYTYGDDDRISVFSISDVTMSRFDGSDLVDAMCIALANAGLTDDNLTLPEGNKVTELNLSGNKLETVDISGYTDMRLLYLSGNLLRDFDFTPFKQLEVAMNDNNYLSSVTLDNPIMWGLSLNDNMLSGIDLTKLPQIEQIGLANNKFKTLSLDNLPFLKAVNLVGNYFNFATLPLRQDAWLSYSYLNQANITVQPDGKNVDLSFTAESQDGTPTAFEWFTERPVLNDDGILEGNRLEIDTDYTLDGATTTFLGNYPEVVCVMTNASFDGLYLYTTPISMSEGVASVSADDIRVTTADGSITVTTPAAIPVALYTVGGSLVGQRNIDGTTTFSHLAPGIYILTTPAGPFRVMVK